MKELVQKRSLNTKVFKKTGRLNVHRIHLTPVHFEKDGVMEEIDSTLELVNGIYKPKKAAFDLDVPEDMSHVGFVNGKLAVDFRPVDSLGLSIESFNTGIRKIVTLNNKPANNKIKFELTCNKRADIYYSDPLKKDAKVAIRKKLKRLDSERIKLEKSGDYDAARKIFSQQNRLEQELFRCDLTLWDKKTTVKFEGKLEIKLGEDIVYIRKPVVWDRNNKLSPVSIELSEDSGQLYFTKILSERFLETAEYPVKTDATTSYYVGAGDGAVGYFHATWATCRGAATGSFNFDTSTTTSVLTTTGYEIDRMFLPVDTSGITDTDTIDSATLYLYTAGKSDANSDSLYVCPTTQASTSALENADYDQLGFTDYGNAALSTFANSQYNTVTINATGLSNISKTGFTKIGVTMGRDFNNNAPTGSNNLNVSMSETSGTSQDPYLEVVTSAAGGTGVSTLTLLGAG